MLDHKCNVTTLNSEAECTRKVQPVNKVVWKLVKKLRPYPKNSRIHSDKQLTQLMASIKEFGFTNPVLIDEKSMVLAGHGRLEAAKRLGLKKIPTVAVLNLTQAQKKAYVIADNQIATKASWDKDILSKEMTFLLDKEFNIEVTGFSTAEVDFLLEDSTAKEKILDPDDLQLEDIAKPDKPVSRLGDLWALDQHLILCGDSLDKQSYKTLMQNERAEMVFTDPPYNVPIEGHVLTGKGKKHAEFAMASGEMSQEEFTKFLYNIFRRLKRHSKKGSIHYVCMDWRHIAEMMGASARVYGPLKQLCVWNKDNGGMGSFYRNKHELVFVFKNGDAKHINNFGLGENGRYRTNVWDYAGVNTMKAGRSEELSMHPTVKPVALVTDAIRDCSRRNGIILDPFSGSGTIIMAAERAGRRARTIEIDPVYVDTAINRWQHTTGKQAFHVKKGLSFDEMMVKRTKKGG